MVDLNDEGPFTEAERRWVRTGDARGIEDIEGRAFSERINGYIEGGGDISI